MTKTTMLGAVSALACAALLAGCGGGGQSASTTATTTAEAASATAPTTAADAAATPAAATPAPTGALAAGGAAIPAAYQGHWSTTEYGCTSPANSGFHFNITANGFQDLFHDTYAARGVQARNGGIVVDATRCTASATPCPSRNLIETDFTFAVSADGATMTYTDRNNIATPYRRCPAGAAPAG